MIFHYFLLYASVSYMIGIAVSQSLMSLGSTLLALGFFFLLFERLLDPDERRELLGSSKTERCALAGIILYTIFGAVQLWRIRSQNISLEISGLNAENAFEWSGLKHLPLFCIPFLPVLLKKSMKPFSRAALRNAGLLYAAAFLASCLFAIYQASVEGVMAIAWMKNPIFLAYNLLFQVLMIAVIIPQLSKSYRAGASVLIALGMLAIFATNSRMASLCVVVLIGLISGRWAWKNLSKKWIIMGVVAMSTFGISEYVRKPYVQDRVHNALNFDSPSWRGRLKAWDHNLEIIRDNPLTGVGPMHNGLYTRDLNGFWQGLWGDNVVIYAHSLYLQWLAESGVIGTLLIMAALGCLALTFPYLKWPLLALLISGLTENVLTNSKPLHAFLGTTLVIGLLSQLGYLRQPSKNDS